MFRLFFGGYPAFNHREKYTSFFNPSKAGDNKEEENWLNEQIQGFDIHSV
jgi:hypothetical protein